METSEDSIHQRVAVLVEVKEKGNKSSFARRLGVAPGVVSDILGGRKNKPGFDVLQKIALAYNDVNTSWLLLGEGEMFLSSANSTSTNTANINKNSGIGINNGTATQHISLEDCKRNLEAAQREVEQLKAQLASTEAQLAGKEVLLAAKDDLIAAKEEMLSLLRAGHNRPN